LDGSTCEDITEQCHSSPSKLNVLLIHRGLPVKHLSLYQDAVLAPLFRSSAKLGCVRILVCRTNGWNPIGLGKWSALSESLPGRIFISYRRQETAWPAGRLYDVLVEHFPPEQVFKDVDNIDPGDEFVERITAAVESCDVLLALIGPQWLTITNKKGQRRLDPEDYVRLEIEAALTRKIRVIPILVDEAQMPGADELPVTLAPLIRRNAVEISPLTFDTKRLITTVQKTLAEEQARRQAQEQARRQAEERVLQPAEEWGGRAADEEDGQPTEEAWPAEQRGPTRRKETLPKFYGQVQQDRTDEEPSKQVPRLAKSSERGRVGKQIWILAAAGLLLLYRCSFLYTRNFD
jgi:hypothetical protein